MPIIGSSLAYTTTAALIVAVGAAAVSLALPRKATVRERLHIDANQTRRWWHLTLFLEAVGLVFYAAYRIANGQSLLSFALFSPRGGGATVSDSQQFLATGLDISIGAGIAAAVLLSDPRYKRKARGLLVVNLLLYATIGFKYRLVVLLLGVFAVKASSRERHVAVRVRARQIRLLLLGAAVTLGVFLVLQTFRGNHEIGAPTTAGSFAPSRLLTIVGDSIDIVSPYAAVHQAGLPQLRGKSYLELPSLFVPRVLLPDKPVPAAIGEVRKLTNPGVGAAVPLWAEADLNFGTLGLLFFGAALGMISNLVDRMDRTRLPTCAIAVATTVVLPSVLSRSLMFFAIYELVMIVGPLTVVARRMRGRARVPACGTKQHPHPLPG